MQQKIRIESQFLDRPGQPFKTVVGSVEDHQQLVLRRPSGGVVTTLRIQPIDWGRPAGDFVPELVALRLRYCLAHHLAIPSVFYYKLRSGQRRVQPIVKIATEDRIDTFYLIWE